MIHAGCVLLVIGWEVLMKSRYKQKLQWGAAGLRLYHTWIRSCLPILILFVLPLSER